MKMLEVVESMVHLSTLANYIAKDYLEKDIRKSFLNNINTFLITYGYTLRIIDISLNSNLITEFGLKSQKEVNEYCFKLDLITRSGLVTQIHFQLDNLINNLLIEVLNIQPKQSFYQNYKSLQESIGIENDNCLDVLSHIRNCLHNNGIHGNHSKEYIVEGRVFKFEKGTAIDCSDWENICFLLQVILKKTIPDLFKSQLIKEQHFILDKTYLSPNYD